MSFRTWFDTWQESRRKRRLLSTSFTFKGWKDPDLAKKYHESLGFYADEISDRHTDIRFPKGILQFYTNKTKGDAPDIGSQVDVIYFPETLVREQIKKFFDDAGLIVE